ncbi:hypothetical protein VPHD479_0182 [Vibrio phage D479]
MRADFSADFYNMITFLQTYEHRNGSIECRTGSFQLGRATGHTEVLKSTVKRLKAEGNDVMVVGLKCNQDGCDVTYDKFTRGEIFRGHRNFPDVIIFECFSHPNVPIGHVYETIADIECRVRGRSKPVYFKVQ